MVLAATGNGQFRDQVATLVRHLHPRDYLGELAQIAAVAARVRYTRDPVGVEAFTPPPVLLGRLQGTRAGPAVGDCDDHAMLVAAMAEAIGHPSRFVVGGDASRWSHVWTEVLVGDRWHAIETTKPMTDPRTAFDRFTTSDGAGLARDAAPGYGARMDYSRGRAGADLGDLDGFKIKKLGKIFRPIEKAVSRVTPAPIKKVGGLVSTAVKAVAVKPWEQVGAAYKKVWDTHRTLLAAAAPIAGPIANMIAPGSGSLIPLVAKKPSTAPPLTMQQAQEPFPFAVPGGNQGSDGAGFWETGGGSSYQQSGTAAPSSGDASWLLIAAAGALFLLTRGRRR